MKQTIFYGWRFSSVNNFHYLMRFTQRFSVTLVVVAFRAREITQWMEWNWLRRFSFTRHYCATKNWRTKERARENKNIFNGIFPRQIEWIWHLNYFTFFFNCATTTSEFVMLFEKREKNAFAPNWNSKSDEKPQTFHFKSRPFPPTQIILLCSKLPFELSATAWEDEKIYKVLVQQ